MIHALLSIDYGVLEVIDDEDDPSQPEPCERCNGTGEMTIWERAIGINAGIGIPDGQWFSWKDECSKCGGTEV